MGGRHLAQVPIAIAIAAVIAIAIAIAVAVAVIVRRRHLGQWRNTRGTD